MTGPMTIERSWREVAATARARLAARRPHRAAASFSFDELWAETAAAWDSLCPARPRHKNARQYLRRGLDALRAHEGAAEGGATPVKNEDEVVTEDEPDSEPERAGGAKPGVCFAATGACVTVSWGQTAAVVLERLCERHAPRVAFTLAEIWGEVDAAWDAVAPGRARTPHARKTLWQALTRAVDVGWLKKTGDRWERASGEVAAAAAVGAGVGMAVGVGDEDEASWWETAVAVHEGLCRRHAGRVGFAFDEMAVEMIEAWEAVARGRVLHAGSRSCLRRAMGYSPPPGERGFRIVRGEYVRTAPGAGKRVKQEVRVRGKPPSWWETALGAHARLRARLAPRVVFGMDEIREEVLANWRALCGTRRKHERIESFLKRAIANGCHGGAVFVCHGADGYEVVEQEVRDEGELAKAVAPRSRRRRVDAKVKARWEEEDKDEDEDDENEEQEQEKEEEEEEEEQEEEEDAEENEDSTDNGYLDESGLKLSSLPTWEETALAAYERLCRSHPTRVVFSFAELWSETFKALRGFRRQPEHLHNSRRRLQSALQKKSSFTKHGESYARTGAVAAAMPESGSASEAGMHSRDNLRISLPRKAPAVRSRDTFDDEWDICGDQRGSQGGVADAANDEPVEMDLSGSGNRMNVVGRAQARSSGAFTDPPCVDFVAHEADDSGGSDDEDEDDAEILAAEAVVLFGADEKPPTWLDTVRAAFVRLSRREPDRTDFTQKEMYDYIEAYWEIICWDNIRASGWRSKVRSMLISGRFADGRPLFAPRRKLPANRWTLAGWQGAAGEVRSRKVRRKDIDAVASAPLWDGPTQAPAQPRRRSRVGTRPRKHVAEEGSSGKEEDRREALRKQRERTLTGAFMPPAPKRRRTSGGRQRAKGSAGSSRQGAARSSKGRGAQVSPIAADTQSCGSGVNEPPAASVSTREVREFSAIERQSVPARSEVAEESVKESTGRAFSVAAAPVMFSYDALPLYGRSLGAETYKRYASALEAFTKSDEYETYQSRVSFLEIEMIPALLDEALASFVNATHADIPGMDGWGMCSDLKKAMLHRNTLLDDSMLKMASACLLAWRTMLPGSDGSTVATV